MQADPAGIGLLLLPGFCDLYDVVVLELDPAKRRFGELRLILFWRISVDPLAGLGAKRGFLPGVVEIHRRTSRSVPALEFVIARSACHEAILPCLRLWIALRSSQ